MDCLAAIIVCIASCDVACKYSGYDFGSYAKAQCICSDRKDYSRMMKKKTTVPSKWSNTTPGDPPPVDESAPQISIGPIKSHESIEDYDPSY